MRGQQAAGITPGRVTTPRDSSQNLEAVLNKAEAMTLIVGSVIGAGTGRPACVPLPGEDLARARARLMCAGKLPFSEP
jgi:hypothetical protein